MEKQKELIFKSKESQMFSDMVEAMKSQLEAHIGKEVMFDDLGTDYVVFCDPESDIEYWFDLISGFDTWELTIQNS